MTLHDQRLSFGPKEWIGLAALALTPACGFTAWGYAVSQRLAVVEVDQRHLVQYMARHDDSSHLERLVRLEAEVSSLRHLLHRPTPTQP